MSTPVRLSILIVNWNVRDLLAECLRSVQGETTLADAEVVVVDNASTDGSVELLRTEFPWVRLVCSSRNLGFAGGNNSGWRFCQGRFRVLLNPDTVVTDRALDRLVDWLEAHPRAAVAGCRLLNSDGTLQRWTGGARPSLPNVATHALFLDRLLPACLRPRPLFLLRDVATDQRVDWVSGACLVLRTEAITGPLFNDDYFMYAEDVDLCERLSAAGWEVWYTPCATVVHHHGRSIRQQSGAVGLSPIRGPRSYFAKTHGRLSVFAYDVLTATGYALRWLAHGLGSCVAGGPRRRERAIANRRLMTRTLQVMRSRP